MTTPRLTLVPDEAELRRRWDRRAKALELPTDLAGHRITWQTWKPRIRVSHHDPRCEFCQADDSASVRGTILRPPRFGQRAPRKLVRYRADGCLPCGAVVVMDLYPDPASLVFAPADVWSNRGQQVLL